MSEDLDPQASQRVDELLSEARTPLDLETMPPAIPLDETASKGKELFREPTPDPKRHPFEVYVKGYTGTGLDEAEVFVAWGTFVASERDLSGHPIAHLNDSFTVQKDDWIWIEVVFALDGSITSCDLKGGGTWDDFPATFRDDGEDGNTWYHPIAQVRDMLNAKGGAGFDSGEAPELKTGVKIAQLTNTHLMKRRDCVGDELVRIWTLQPGHGGSPS